MQNNDLIFVGIKGTAIALHRASGQIVWQTHLRGSGFVNLVLEGDNLYATAQGEVFCLDPATGAGRWNNELKGYGWGLASIAVPNAVGASNQLLAAEQEELEAQQSHIATAAPAS
ncbi:MAG: hypothetical protein JWQ04_808 [Pedosphaera sp.]|nr:hypothetical protein [Pedosphaera sp.]